MSIFHESVLVSIKTFFLHVIDRFEKFWKHMLAIDQIWGMFKECQTSRLCFVFTYRAGEKKKRKKEEKKKKLS